jgi:hypothetical protein
MHPSLERNVPSPHPDRLAASLIREPNNSVLHREALARHGASGKNDNTTVPVGASRLPASRWPDQAGWKRILYSTYLICPGFSPSSRSLLFAFQPLRTWAIYVSENDAHEEFATACAGCESPVPAHDKPADIVSKGLAHCADDAEIHHVGRAATATALFALPSQGKTAQLGTLQNAPDTAITTAAAAPAPVVHVAVDSSAATVVAGTLQNPRVTIPSSAVAVTYSSALAGSLQDPSPAAVTPTTPTIPVVSAAGVSSPAQASIPSAQGVATGGSSPSQVSGSNVQGAAVSNSVAVPAPAGGSAEAAAAAASVVSHISRPSSQALENRRDEPYEHS